MQTVKRLYLYAMSGATLAILLFGLTTLLSLALRQLGVASAAIGGDAIRDQLALAGALIAVGLVAWAIHWWFVQRSVAAGRPRADEERSSAIRALYLALVLAGLLLSIANNALALLVQLTESILGAPRSASLELALPAATVVVSGIAFAYHVGVRLRDRSLTEFAGAAAWLPRLYRYAAALAGGLVALFGVVTLINVAGDLLAAEANSLRPPAWWAVALAEGLAATIVGGLVWIGHSMYSERLRRAMDHASGEAESRLRVAYWLALLAAGVTAVIFFGGNAMEAALAELLGAPPLDGGFTTPGAPLWLMVAVPLASAVPFAVVAGLAFRAVRSEAAESADAARRAAVRRLTEGLPALIGLAFAAVAGSRLVGVAIEVAFSGSILDLGSWRHEAADLLPFVLLGGLAWALGWFALQADRRRDPDAEARSTLRRAYLLLVLAGSVLASVSSVGLILYRLFTIALGAEVPSGLASELSGPIGVLLVSGLLAVYHGLGLARDMRLTGGLLTGMPRATDRSAPTARVTVVLSGPDEADLYGMVDELRDRLPAGVSLELPAVGGRSA